MAEQNTTAQTEGATAQAVDTAQTTTAQVAPAQEAQPAQTDTQAEPLQADGADEGVLTDSLGQDNSNAQSDQNTEGSESSEGEKQEVDPDDTVPEGEYIFFDEQGQEVAADEVANFQSVFKEAHLTIRQARQLKAAYDKAVGEISTQLQQNAINQSNEWLRTVKNDRELGGNNLNNTKLNIGRAMEAFGSPELKEYLKTSRMGNHPDFVRFMNNVGQAIGEDKFIGGSSGRSPAEVAEAKRLYPNSPELWGGR